MRKYKVYLKELNSNTHYWTIEGWFSPKWNYLCTMPSMLTPAFLALAASYFSLVTISFAPMASTLRKNLCLTILAKVGFRAHHDTFRRLLTYWIIWWKIQIGWRRLPCVSTHGVETFQLDGQGHLGHVSTRLDTTQQSTKQQQQINKEIDLGGWFEEEDWNIGCEEWKQWGNRL